MSTISVSGPYVLASGQALTFTTNTTAFTADESSGLLATVLDQGDIEVSSSQAGATVTAFDATIGSITIASGGVFSLQANGAGSSAYGYYVTADGAAPFENDGNFTISADASTYGVYEYINAWAGQSSALAFNNTGHFTVTSANGNAEGYWTQDFEKPVSNSGEISVTGGAAVGFDLGYGGALTNTGDITVTGTHGQQSAGIQFSGVYSPSGGISIVSGAQPPFDGGLTDLRPAGELSSPKG